MGAESSGPGFAREDVTFPSADARCAAWLFRPPKHVTTVPGPVVVMAHGFGGVRGLRLDAYAARFAAAGYRVLLFDYRHFGDSDGQPRQLLGIGRQHADWRAAVDHARGLPDVDADRVVLWGTSLAGGHVLHTAARDPRIAAVVAQVPHVSGVAAMGAVGPVMSARLARRAVADLARAALGRDPTYIRAIGDPGTVAAMTAPGARSGHDEMIAQSSVEPPRDDVAARILLRMPTYSPGRRAARIRCPVLVQLADDDRITPARAAERVARRIPRATVLRYAMTHFDPYVHPHFEQVVRDQLTFLRDAVHATA